MQPVDRFGRRGHRRVVSEGRVRADQIIVNRLRQAQYVESLLHEATGHLVRAIASQADQAIKSKAIVSLHCPAGQIDGLAVGQRHAMRFLAAGAQDCAAGGENARDVLQVQHARMIFNQPAIAFFDADHLNVVEAHGGLGHAADGRIEAGTIAAAGEDADAASSTGGWHR